MKDAEILEVTYWYEGLTDWVQLFPVLGGGTQMPTNTPMTIAVRSKNSGDEEFSLRTYLKITDPGGGVLNANPDVYYLPIEPGEDTWIYFDYITFTDIGVYGVLTEDKEFGEDEVFDSLSVNVNVETAPVDVIGPVMPVIGLVMVLGLVGMMATPMISSIGEG